MTLKCFAGLPTRIDHTILRPDVTQADVRRLCEEAKQYGFGAVFVPSCYAEDAVAAVASTAIRVGIPIGFPLGWQTTRSKVAEAIEGREKGALELDMVINVSWLKSGEYDAVRQDIADVVCATPGVGHKVILETGLLTQEEKKIACRLTVEAGADYVKTSSGFGPGGATVEDVRLMKETVAGRAKVKASGGIRDLKTTLALLEAGADRIGTSASAKIIEEWLAQRKN
jgi:deoxyribose-phosphate aldolase